MCNPCLEFCLFAAAIAKKPSHKKPHFTTFGFCAQAPKMPSNCRKPNLKSYLYGYIFFYMKQRYSLLLFSLLTIGLQAQKLQTTISYATFFSPETQTYVETYFSVLGSSLKLQPQADGSLQGGVEIDVFFYQNDQLVTGDRLRMMSPLYPDSAAAIRPFVQQARLALKIGTYDMRLRIRDIFDAAEDYALEHSVSVTFNSAKVQLSDVQMLDSFQKSTGPNPLSKSGYDLIPLVPDGIYYYGPDVEKLSFYAEVYNAATLGADEPYMVKFYLEDFEKRRVLNTYSGFQKFKSNVPVAPLLRTIGIKDLPNGFYALNIQVIDRNNEVLDSRQIQFHRNNQSNESSDADDNRYFAELTPEGALYLDKLADPDTLRRYIESIYPISTIQEQRIAKIQLDGGQLATQQQFFLNFWRLRNPDNPVGEWNRYNAIVANMHNKYGSRILPGYRTDRGRVFLQYGAPTLVEDRRHEPSSYPYEIWQYNQLQSVSTMPQNNRVFVFANLDIGSREYRLIHSDAIGEINDPRWMMRLMKRDFQSNNIDETGNHIQGSQPGSRMNNGIIMQGASPMGSGYRPQ